MALKRPSPSSRSSAGPAPPSMTRALRSSFSLNRTRSRALPSSTGTDSNSMETSRGSGGERIRAGSNRSPCCCFTGLQLTSVRATASTAAGRAKRTMAPPLDQESLRPSCSSDIMRTVERPPDPVGRGRHVEMPDAGLTKRVGDRVHDRRQRAADSRFPDALGAERIGRRRHRVLVDAQAADETRARHGIVHEAAGQKLSGLRIVYSDLPEDLTRALGDAALHLALDDLGVHQVARVVHRGEAHDLGDARVGLDLDLGDVAAVREGDAELALGLDVERLLRARAPL